MWMMHTFLILQAICLEICSAKYSSFGIRELSQLFSCKSMCWFRTWCDLSLTSRRMKLVPYQTQLFQSLQGAVEWNAVFASHVSRTTGLICVRGEIANPDPISSRQNLRLSLTDWLTDHLANRLRLMIGFNNSLETVLEQKVKAIIYIEKGLNCEIFPGDKFTLGVTSQLQIECSVLDKIFRR